MSNAANAFHWSLESRRATAGWKSQSYGFGDDPFRRARLAVVYDLHSPGYLRQFADNLVSWAAR